MNDYIINHPQLQSLRNRLGSLLVWAICWLMWVYLLVPLLTLAGWLLGDYKMTEKMRWFGGYSSLLQLLEICATTLLIQALLWLCWVFFRSRRKRRFLAAVGKIVDDVHLSAFYHVRLDELEQCRNARLITVFFDEHGTITHLEPVITVAGQSESGIDDAED